MAQVLSYKPPASAEKMFRFSGVVLLSTAPRLRLFLRVSVRSDDNEVNDTYNDTVSPPLSVSRNSTSLQLRSQTLNPASQKVSAFQVQSPCFFHDPIVVHRHPIEGISRHTFKSHYTYLIALSYSLKASGLSRSDAISASWVDLLVKVKRADHKLTIKACQALLLTGLGETHLEITWNYDRLKVG